MSDQKQLEVFVGKTFRSVWALEILKFLSDNEGQSLRGEDLISALRLSQAVVHQSVKDLVVADLVAVDVIGVIALVTDNQSELVQAAIKFYASSPNKVRRWIVAQHL